MTLKPKKDLKKIHTQMKSQPGLVSFNDHLTAPPPSPKSPKSTKPATKPAPAPAPAPKKKPSTMASSLIGKSETPNVQKGFPRSDTKLTLRKPSTMASSLIGKSKTEAKVQKGFPRSDTHPLEVIETESYLDKFGVPIGNPMVMAHTIGGRNVSNGWPAQSDNIAKYKPKKK